MSALVRLVDGGGGRAGERVGAGPMFWCVACGCAHGGFAGWTWDGNETAPTITPSYAVKGGEGRPFCHVNVTNGQLVYHADSKHALRGKTVPMEPL